MLTLRQPDKNPESQLDAWLESARPGELLALQYALPRFWEPGAGADELFVVYELCADQSISFVVHHFTEDMAEQLRNFEGSLSGLAEQLDAEVFNDGNALPLQPVHIPKPWGEEIWYTGMEVRGVAGVGSPSRVLPLPWVLSAMPGRLCKGHDRNLMLLKILAPRPEEVLGDLYFELHEEKREVYVVTHIDPVAWPNGEGAIRFGFSETMRATCCDDERFKAAFAKAVADYEAVRREIDALLDQLEKQTGAEREQLLDQVSCELQSREQQLRLAMNAFTALKPLRLGDVVKVPTLTPHSLQHGVRTIEFQTPVYERLIVSFAQKVLTQSHWDTAEALSKMVLDTPPQPESESLLQAAGVTVERIVDFDDFEVRRIEVSPGASFYFAQPAVYAVLIVIQGPVAVASLSLAAEQAALIPASSGGFSIKNSGSESLIFLAGYPRP